MTTSEAKTVTGGLSNPSKMPGRAFGLPAAGEACPIGARLARVPGTVCHGCYAVKGMYGFRTVREAQNRRLDSVRAAIADPEKRARWIAAMVTLVSREKWFRWHDSGDVFSAEYLAMIVDVVKRTPETRHWLPTRELITIRDYVREHGPMPENLTVRLSLPRVDATREQADAIGRAYGMVTSTVTTGAPTCPAPKQGNECRDCRACWDRDVPHVSYRKH